MKARVKVGNSYGGVGAGEIVDVDDGEIDKVPWCLEPVTASAEARLIEIGARFAELETEARALDAERRAIFAKLDEEADQRPVAPEDLPEPQASSALPLEVPPPAPAADPPADVPPPAPAAGAAPAPVDPAPATPAGADKKGKKSKEDSK
jgi:hypothetical protein